MAVKRAVSTVLAVEGINEYKTAMQDIRRELGTLKSALKLTEEQFKGNANSMAALEAKGKALKDVLGKEKEAVNNARKALDLARNAQEAYAKRASELRERIAEAEKELEELKNTSSDATTAQKKLTAEIESLNKELQDTEARQKGAANGVELWQKNLNTAQTQVVKFERELEKNNKYLAEAKASSDGTAKSIDNMGKEVKQAGRDFQSAGDDVKDFGRDTKRSLEEIEDVMAALGLTKMLSAIVDGFRASVDASIEFESAMAGVAKTTDLSQGELSQMGKQIRELSTEIPITTTEFSGIVEIAGQLGIAKESLLDFSKVMANLGVATNLTSEEAATMLAQFANITQMDPSAYSNLGSAVVALGNSFATNERSIVEMTQRIAAAGTIAGMSEADMLGLSAAVTSMGISADNGGTQMGKLTSMIQRAVETGDKLDQFASIAGMSAEDFATAWGNDATSALIKFITGLNDVERNGKSAIVLLGELKINEARMQTMMLSLAGAGTLLSDAVNVSNEAWAENTALTKEAATRYATTESKLAMMRNAYNNLSIAIGDKLSPIIRAGADTLTSFAEKLEEMVESSDLLVPALVGAATAVGVLVAAFAAYTIIDKVRHSVVKFISYMTANPWMIWATAIAAAVAALVTFAAACGDSEYSVKNLTTASREIKKVFKEQDEQFKQTSNEILATAQLANAYVNQLAELEQKTSLTVAEQAKWNMLLSQIVELVPETSHLIDQQTGSIEGGTQALRGNIQAWQQQALAQARQEAYYEKYKAFAAVEVEAQTNLDKRIKKENELLAIKSEMDSMEAQIEAATRGRSAAEQEGNQVLQKKIDRYNELVDEYAKADEELNNLDKALEKNQDTLTEYSEELGVNSSVLDGWTSGVVASSDQVSEANAKTQSEIDALNNQLASLQEAYMEAYEEAEKSVNKQFGAFDKIEKKAATSVKQLKANFDSQIEYFTNYTENLKKAAELGINQGLIATLSDGSVESMAILQGIVNDNGQSVDEINRKWEEVNNVKSTAIAAMADAKTAFSTNSEEIQGEIDALVEHMNQEDEAAENGKKTMNGYTKGLESALPALRGVSNQILSYLYPKAIAIRGAGSSSPTAMGSHAKGLSIVPYDGYIAELHKGERVLTAKEAQEYNNVLLASIASSYDTPSRDYSGILQSIRSALASSRGNITNKATLQFYGEQPSPARTAREVEKTMRRMLYGY